MTEPVPLRSLPPAELFFPPDFSSKQDPSTSLPPSISTWEGLARAWLSSLPAAHVPSPPELDTWIESNASALPPGIRSLPRSNVHQLVLSLRSPLLSNQLAGGNEAELAYRFQRTDLWKPVYIWLESMDKDTIVNSKEISEWLSANPKVMDKLFTKHSRYHMMHYIQRMHLKMLKKSGKLPKGLQLSAARASAKVPNGGMTIKDITCPSKISGHILQKKKPLLPKNREAYLRYELLTDLQNQLRSALFKENQTSNSKDACPLVTPKPENIPDCQSSEMGRCNTSTHHVPDDESKIPGLVSIRVTEQSKPLLLVEPNGDRRRRRNPVIATPAWSYSEMQSETSEIDQSSNLLHEEARKLNIWKGDSHSFAQNPPIKNILTCMQGREKGFSWRSACYQSGYAGKNREQWVPFLQGWRSVENQFEGPAVYLTRRSYLSWSPTWCSYMSNMANGLPNGRQGVQKVLDVRFHPEGLPQLICSSNEAPNELLLYNLLSGRAVPLVGHNSKIQAVEFAARGASIVSCGSNLLKVWDCTTGSCLHTLGSPGSDHGSVGHNEKINTMTVNHWQSCLVVTSSAKGDGKLLLWNALRGELTADLNLNLRKKDQVHSSILSMKFCSENTLVCGSDGEFGDPAVLQLWHIESPSSYFAFPAHDAYISSLDIHPSCNTIITGAGDGTLGLFDIRTCSALNHLSVGSGYEVTSVSFSSCGTYFAASNTSNNTLVWDTRFLPMNHRMISPEYSCDKNDMRFFRPLHCLSHGQQMPTAEHAAQLPGHVDKGDQGVNDARWLHEEPVLVTVSGDGSIAMWDVTLGQPCVRHIVSHSRCTNTVDVSPNGEYLCTGGDDQKVVLYQNRNRNSRLRWRLTYPLEDDT